MDVDTGLGLLAIVVLVLVNGFFVATEFAIVAVRRSRLEELAREGSAAAKRVQEIVKHLDMYIAACQLGITLASLALGWIGEPALARLIEPPFARLVGAFAPAAAHGVAIGVAFAFITALHIVVGELAPKGLALQRPEGTALWVARPLHIFYLVFRWPITALNAVGNAVLARLGLRRPEGHELVHSVDELALLLNASQQAGVVEETEARIARRAFQFADLTAGSLMTPRTQVEAVPITIDRDEFLAHAAASSHSRLLVYEGSLDNILGAFRVRDLLRVLRQDPATFDLRAVLRPVLTVPETRAADELLEDMRGAARHLALVVDEYGGTAGIVTLGDVLRTLVGRIDDEAPLGSTHPGARVAPETEADGSRLLDGLMKLHEFEEAIGSHLTEEQRAGVATLSGLITKLLDKMPAVADEVRVAGRQLRVERLDGRRITSVRLLPERPVTGVE